MSNAEIISYLSASQRVCGRFDQQQVNNINNKLHAESLIVSGWWKRAVIVASMLGPISLNASGQTRQEVAASVVDTARSNSEPQMDNHIIGKIVAPSRAFRTIKGSIVDKQDGLPIPGVMVKIKGTNIITQTNTSGTFVVNGPSQFTTLVVSLVGYNTQEIPFTDNASKVADVYLQTVRLQTCSAMLGEVVMVYKKPSFTARVWYKIKRIF